MTSGLWYRAVLCDALVAAPQLPMIREHFADALGAAPSPPPDREWSTLLVGEQSDWDLLPRGTH